MADTITIDAPLSADAAKVYKGAKADPYVFRRETPAGAADASPAISSAKVAVVLNRGEEAWVVFTASGAFVAARKVQAGRPAAGELTQLSPTTFAGNSGAVIRVIGTNFSAGSVVFFNAIRQRTRYISPTEVQFTLPTVAAGSYPVKVRNGGIDTNALTFTAT